MSVQAWCDHNAPKAPPAQLVVPAADDPLVTAIRQALDARGIEVEEIELPEVK